MSLTRSGRDGVRALIMQLPVLAACAHLQVSMTTATMLEVRIAATRQLPGTMMMATSGGTLESHMQWT